MVTVIAPTGRGIADAWQLALRLRRPICDGFGTLAALQWGFTESATIDPASRLVPSAIVRSYRRVLTHPVCLGYLVMPPPVERSLHPQDPRCSSRRRRANPNQYGFIFGACSAAVMAGAFLDSRLGARGISSATMLMIGSVLAAAATLLLTMTVVGWMPFRSSF